MKKTGSDIPAHWKVTRLAQACEILDQKRIPVNNRERQKRINGKNESGLFPYYGSTGKVGFIDDYIFNGEYVLLGEDGAPFLDSYINKAYLVKGNKDE